MSIGVRFYDANKKHTWTVFADLEGDEITAAVPSRNARYYSCEVDDHKLHELPKYDPMKVEYRADPK